ncbi:major facilitator superfamily domain-containing protein [Phlebopus sp. FC_14]|nr:major facilitator superfamily domain-containing protein [Phlebopus sp. FC_14]
MDEETPLLQQQSEDAPKTRTPFPWRQFSILLMLQVSEPLTSQVISPFLPQLIRDIGVTKGDDSRIGYYVGLMHSLFFLTEACTIFHWSRISDHVGRKPVLLTGLFGLSISMYCFGLSETFRGLVISRCLNGALNGNIGIMKSMVAEITDSTNIAQAYGILPFAWGAGSTLGPLIGGSLARPVDRFPGVFGHSAFLKKYPYFLPCAIPATFTALSWLITLLFMKETRKPQKPLREYLPWAKHESDASKTSPPSSVPPSGDEAPVPFRGLLTRPVLIAAGSYATFSLIDMAFRAVLPVFYATSIDMGGLNLDPPAIGTILSIYGMVNGVIVFFIFTPMHDWLGARTMFLVTTCACIPMIALFPIMNLVARQQGFTNTVWVLVSLQMAFLMISNLAYGITFIFISAAAPNRASIGATNGLAQMIVSLMRAIGPAVVNSAFSLGVERHSTGGNLAYWVMVVMVGMTLAVGFALPKDMWKK